MLALSCVGTCHAQGTMVRAPTENDDVSHQRLAERTVRCHHNHNHSLQSWLVSRRRTFCLFLLLVWWWWLVAVVCERGCACIAPLHLFSLCLVLRVCSPALRLRSSLFLLSRLELLQRYTHTHTHTHTYTHPFLFLRMNELPSLRRALALFLPPSLALLGWVGGWVGGWVDGCSPHVT